MSFNIRYGTANDGDNRWPLRRDFLVDVMREQTADVVGLQEALDFQIDEIIAALPIYGVIGVGRDDGARKGEYSAILFRRDRFQVSDAGTFWFSDTPDVVASKSWGTGSRASAPGRGPVDRDGRRSGTTTSISITSRAVARSAARALRSGSTPAGSAREPGHRDRGSSTPASRIRPSPRCSRGARWSTRSGSSFRTRRCRHLHAFTIPRRDRPEKIDYVFVPGRPREVVRFRPKSCGRRGTAGYRPDHFPVIARFGCKTPLINTVS